MHPRLSAAVRHVVPSVSFCNILRRYGCGGAARCYAAALVQYGLAAAQGLDEAQFWLGDMHFHGKGVDDNFEEAVRWCVGAAAAVIFCNVLRMFKLAGEQGHPEACHWVSLCYKNGWGVAVDEAEARAWSGL